MVGGYVDELNSQAQPLGDHQEVGAPRPRPDRRVRRAHPVDEGQAQRRPGQQPGADRRSSTPRADHGRVPVGALAPRSRVRHVVGYRRAPAQPDGDVAPEDGCCPTRRGPSSAASPSASTSTCRSARCGAATATSTPTRPHELGRTAVGRLAGDVRRRRDRRDPAGARRCSATATSPVETVFFGGGTPTLLQPGRPRRASWRAIAAEFGLAADAEVTTEANPDSVDAGRPRRRCATAGFNRISLRHAVGGRPRAARRSTAPTTRRACPTVVDVGPGRPASSSVSLDLIYGTPGESLADWRGLARRGARLRGPTTSRRTPSSSRTAPRWPARSAAASCRCPTTTTWPTSTLADERLAAAGLSWYEVSNWARDEAAAVPAQPPLLDRRRLVGRRPRRALATSAACGGGTSSTPRRTPSGSPRASARRTAARCSTPRPAGSSGSCSSCGSRRAAAGRPRRAGRAVAGWSRRAGRWPTETGWCSPARPAARRRVVRDLLP